MKNIKTITGAIVVLFMSITACRVLSQAKVYTFSLPILDEIAGSNLGIMLNDVVKVISEKTGIKSEVKKRTFTRGEQTLPITRQSFEKDNTDFGLVFSEDYVRLIKENDRNPVIVPLAVLSMNGHKEMEICFYVKKNSSYNKVGDLKGGKVGAATASSIRYLLHKEAGYDDSLFNFFSDVKFISDMNVSDLVKSTIAGEIDTFAVNKYSYAIANKGPEAGQLKTLACAPYVLNFIIAAHRGVDPVLTSKVKTLFLKAHKDEAFSRFKFLFTAIKGKFENISKDDLKNTRAVMELLEKYNWENDDVRIGKLKPKETPRKQLPRSD